MKLIIAIIQPNKLDDVMDALDEKEIHLRTVNNVLGCGRQKGIPEVYRGVVESGRLTRKVRLEIAVNDPYVEPAIQAIVTAAKTGQTGDGKIFVLELQQCVRIRTEERDGVAIG